MKNSDKIILDLCGGTGAWSKPYAEAGYDVRVITLPEWDILDEATVEYCTGQIPYGVLCAVECTMWCAAAARWWKHRTSDEIYYHARLLVKCLRIIYESNPVFWVIENPVGKMKGFLGEPVHKFNPCDYGDPYSKKTYLWGRFNIPKKDRVLMLSKNFIHGMPPSPDRQKLRAITPPGFAKAFFKANP